MSTRDIVDAYTYAWFRGDIGMGDKIDRVRHVFDIIRLRPPVEQLS